MQYALNNKIKIVLGLLFAIILAGLLLFLQPKLSAHAAHSSGPIQIRTLQDLQNMDKNLYGSYELANDIDASASKNDPFAPIGDTLEPFQGSFNGHGHVIKNLYIKSASLKAPTGLFGEVGPISQGPHSLYIIENFTLSNVHVVGGDSVGAVVGYLGNRAEINNVAVDGGSVQQLNPGGRPAGGIAALNAGVIKNSHNSATVSGGITGGIAGVNDSDISTSYNTGNITAAEAAGGIAGSSGGETLTQCFNTGKIVGQTYVGGIIGESVSFSKIKQCYNTGEISGNTATEVAGGIAGKLDNPGQLSNSYNAGTITATGAKKVVGALVGSFYGQAIQNSFWDSTKLPDVKIVGFNMGSGIDKNSSGKTTAQMQQKATFSNVGWDFSNIWLIKENKSYPYFSFSPQPIPTIYIKTYDNLNNIRNQLGANYILANNIDASGHNFQPIGDNNTPFTGTLDGKNHIISNLTINQPNKTYLGLFGETSKAKISNLGLENISITGGDAAKAAGSFVGYAINSSLTHLFATGVINAPSAREPAVVGGLIGITSTGTTLSNSYNNTKITSSHTSGGLVGNSSGSISDCYNLGPVINPAPNVSIYAGGLVGILQGALTNSYNVGAVSGASLVGGIAGAVFNQVPATKISNVYWNQATSGMSKATGQGDATGATALTTAKMMQQNNYSNWNFQSTWNISQNNSFPYLQWQFSSTPEAVSGLAYSAVPQCACPKDQEAAISAAKINILTSSSDAALAWSGANGFYYSLLNSSDITDQQPIISYFADNSQGNALTLADSNNRNLQHNLNLYINTISLYSPVTGSTTINKATLESALGFINKTDLKKILYSFNQGQLNVTTLNNIPLYYFASPHGSITLEPDSTLNQHSDCDYIDNNIVLNKTGLSTAPTGQYSFNGCTFGFQINGKIEPNSSGITVNLLINNSNGEALYSATATTDANGNYSFSIPMTKAKQLIITNNTILLYSSAPGTAVTLLNHDIGDTKLLTFNIYANAVTIYSPEGATTYIADKILENARGNVSKDKALYYFDTKGYMYVPNSNLYISPSTNGAVILVGEVRGSTYPCKTKPCNVCLINTNKNYNSGNYQLYGNKISPCS